jgi:hypothetical protein
MSKGIALLIEKDFDLTESLIEESKDNSKEKKYMIKGIFMQSDVKNRNGRIYPEHVMDKDCHRYINEKILTNQAAGELNHPTGDGSLSVNYERTTHKIDKLIKQGKNWYGEATIAHKTPLGSTIAGLMDIGIVMGTSSRATGSLKLDGMGTKIVQEDFKIITPSDIVSDPSAPDAYLTSIMEGNEWVLQNGALTEMAYYEVKDVINKNAKAIKDEKRLIEVFQWIITNKVGK